jgi:hypothetical protein
LKCVSINFFCFKKDAKKRHVGHVKVWMLYTGVFNRVSSVSVAKVVVSISRGLIKAYQRQIVLFGFGTGFCKSKHWKLYPGKVDILFGH